MPDYSPGAAAAIDWTPNVNSGVGVPGGITHRETVYQTITSTGDTTDRTLAIKIALSNCPSGQVVLLGAGTFYVSTSFSCANTTIYYQDHYGDDNFIEYVGIGGKTLRGSGSNPATGTVIKYTGSASIGINGGQFTSDGPGGDVTGSPTKGDTTLSITNAGSAVVGRIMVLATENDETLPVVSTRGYNFIKAQYVTITAVNSGAGTVTFQPALYQTPVKRTGGALAMAWGMSHGRDPVAGFGLEDLCIDNTDGSGATNFVLSGTRASWMRNVRAKGINRYGLGFDTATQCEMRQCWVDQNTRGDWTGSSHAGVPLSNASALLIEDNVILPNFPVIESQNGVISGSVIAYNFGLQAINNVCFSSHSTGDHCNLWEGNSTTNITQDGYFGGTSDNVVYRNDLHGVVLGSGVPHWPIQVNRFGRRWEVVGNQLGRSGTTLDYEFGRPNAFNGYSSGNANNWTGDPHIDLSLTGTATRIADNSYTVAMDTTVGGLINQTWPVTMRWGTYGASFRTWLAVTSSPSGLTVALGDNGANNSWGSVATTGTTVRLWPGENDGFQEWDDAVEYSAVILGNYAYKDGAIDVSLGSTTLPNSLFRSSAPSFMSGYNWPPYGPTSPDPRYDAIPAGARYLAEANTVASPSFSPVAGAYASSQSVTITCATSGATIYYTTDGTTPTTSSSVYSSALTIAVSPSTTLKAFAVKSGMTDSGVTSGVYSYASGTPTHTPSRAPALFSRRR